MRRGGLSFGDRKIKFLQALSWWVLYLTLKGKPIELNNFKRDIMSGTIEESQLDHEQNKYGKEELNKNKDFSHDKCNQW